MRKIIERRYFVSTNFHNVRNWLIIFIGIVFCGFILSQFVSDIYVRENLTLLCIGFGLADFFLFFIYILEFFLDGYSIENGEIVYFHNFKKHKKRLSEIKALVISNTFLCRRNLRVNMFKNGKIVHCPWITLFFEEIDSTLLTNIKDELTTIVIESRIYSKHQKFGFIYQRKNIEKILNEFTGKVYIAQTVYNNFKDEISDLFGTKVIYIVPDNL